MCSFSENIRKIISTALCSICSSSALGRCDEKKGASYVLDEPYTVICFLFHETRFLTKSFWGAKPGMSLLKILRPLFAGFAFFLKFCAPFLPGCFISPQPPKQTTRQAYHLVAHVKTIKMSYLTVCFHARSKNP